MLRNLKAVYLKDMDFRGRLARPAQTGIDCIRTSPSNSEIWVSSRIKTDHLGPAIAALESYLKEAPFADDAEPVKAYLRAAKLELALRN